MKADGSSGFPGPVQHLTAAAACLLITAAFSFAVLWETGDRIPFDLYGVHYPNILYALRAVEDGHGLLWNRLQNCGQPFLPGTLVGLFYPLYWLFLWIDIDVGILVVAALQLAIGGFGTYLLARELGLSWAASLCGAIGFALGGTAIQVAGTQPTMVLGTYAWMPAALWLCERLLRRPGFGPGVGLAAVLAVQLLPGYPQVSLFTYQLIGLRVLYEVGLRPRSGLRLLATFGVVLALPPLLAAVQLLPMLEFASESLRSSPLSPEDLRPEGRGLTWDRFLEGLTWRWPPGAWTTFSALGLALAGPALLHPSARRAAVFWLLATALFFALSFDNALFALYQELPLGRLFRLNERFMYVAGFAIAVVGAIGADALIRGSREAQARAPRLALALVPGAAVLSALSATGLRAWEWGVLFGAAAACVIPARRGVATAIVPGLLLANLIALNRASYVSFQADPMLFAHADVFSVVQEGITLHDRVYQHGGYQDLGLMPKSGSVFGVAAIGDYEPQTSRRFAELSYKLTRGAANDLLGLNAFNDLQWRMAANVPLLDLMAARFWIIDTRHVEQSAILRAPGLRPVWRRGSVVVYLNPTALPRALYVPQAVVVEDPKAALNALATGALDPRRFAAIEAPPADGFLGEGANATGSAWIVLDRSEQVVVQTQASAAGFLFLSDQFYPGWSATVNESPAEILRANHAFRLVRVPAGPSTVVFRYRPASFWAGVGVSAGTAGALLVAAAARRWRQRSAPGRRDCSMASRRSFRRRPPP